MKRFLEKFDKLPKQLRLVIIILLTGFLLFRILVSLRKAPIKKELPVIVPLVAAQRVSAEDMQMVVRGFGTVRPKVEIQVVPQVSGRVVKCHADFVNGGFFKAGQPLLIIDQRDYELAVQNAEADVARGQVQLDQESAEAAVARQEWEQMHGAGKPAPPLVLHEPQIRQAKAQLTAAMAQLAIAKLNLERTVISMPFDGRVIEKSVDIGQYLVAGGPIGRVYGTDAVEIMVPLEDKELAWFDVPNGYAANGNPKPLIAEPEALVTADFAGGNYTWKGRVVRAEGQIDAVSRMVNIVVEVEKPFEFSQGRPALVPGMFVEIEIKGKHFQQIIRIRRYAVHNGEEVWVVYDGHLEIRKVEIIRSDKDYAYVAGGLEDGDVIVLSPLDTVTDGMRVRAELETVTEEVEVE